VALDREGRIAAATSTGGMTNKKWGRVGDVPVIGAGTYADPDCGISTTGWGEFFIRNVVAHDVCAIARYRGVSLSRAGHEVVMEKLEAQEEDTGGLVGLDSAGHIIMPFNTPGMYRGWIGEGGNAWVGIYADEG